MARVSIVGIDGLPPALMKYVVEASPRTKALRDLASTSSIKVAKSTIPYVTPPAWTSIFSGYPPSVHGLWDFLDFDDSERRIVYASPRRVRVPMLWKRLSERKIFSIWINVPLFNPPPVIRGIFISGFPHPTPRCWPPHVCRALPEGYETRVVGEERVREDELVKIVSRVVEARTRLALSLARARKGEWRLLATVFVFVDQLLHLYMKRVEECIEEGREHAACRAIERGFEHVDRLVEFLSREARSSIVIVSDHGMGVSRGVLSTLTPLIEAGLTKLTLKGALFSLATRAPRISLALLELASLASSSLRERARFIKRSLLEKRVSMRMIDCGASRAVPYSSSMPVSLVKCFDDEARREASKVLAKYLRGAKVMTCEDVYGACPPGSPSLIIDTMGRYTLSSFSLHPPGAVAETDREGDHTVEATLVDDLGIRAGTPLWDVGKAVERAVLEL